jgi:hypothetical protein
MQQLFIRIISGFLRNAIKNQAKQRTTVKIRETMGQASGSTKAVSMRESLPTVLLCLLNNESRNG